MERSRYGRTIAAFMRIMEKTYLRDITEHFYHVPFEKLDEAVTHQVGRAFMDYIGITAYSVHHKSCEKLVDFFVDVSGAGNSAPFGKKAKINSAGAGAANAARTSSLELDDISGVNASVHAGVYVWSAAIEAYRKHPCDMETFIRAIAFGYDVCIRFGMLVGENVRNFGLHGPGMCGGLAAAATASMIEGLSVEETLNALSITGALLPLCPFVSFIEGTDSKDMYGGWGVYEGLLAIEAVKHGLTGPEKILEGPKGLNLFFRSDRGYDVPVGSEYYLNTISFKEFSGCFAVHPAMSCILELQAENKIDPDAIASVTVETYPYSYALSTGACQRPMNSASARLNLPYCVSYALHEGHLKPDAFTPESMANEAYLSLAKRITVKNHEEYGESDLGIRGCIVEIHMNDGASFQIEVDGARWSNGATDAQLMGKFRQLTENVLSKQQQEETIDCFMNIHKAGNLEKILAVMDDLQ